MMRFVVSPLASGPTSLPNPATRRPSRFSVGGDASAAPGHIHRPTESAADGTPECADEMAVV
jgi:hypothetical protein